MCKFLHICPYLINPCGNSQSACPKLFDILFDVKIATSMSKVHNNHVEIPARMSKGHNTRRDIATCMSKCYIRCLNIATCLSKGHNTRMDITTYIEYRHFIPLLKALAVQASYTTADSIATDVDRTSEIRNKK